MKVANLQLQGLLMAIASINNVLVQKGILSIDEIDTALHKAETNLTSEELSTRHVAVQSRCGLLSDPRSESSQ